MTAYPPGHQPQKPRGINPTPTPFALTGPKSLPARLAGRLLGLLLG